MIRIASVPPSAALAGIVDTHTLYSGAGSRAEFQRVFPSSAIELTVNLSSGEMRCYDPATFVPNRATGPLLSGLFSRYYVIDTAQLDDLVSVRLRPGGAWRLFGVPAHELANQHITLCDLLGRHWNDLIHRLGEEPASDARIRILEATLLATTRRREMHPAVGYALNVLRKPGALPRALSLAKDTGLSFRRFNELFLREVGLTVKSFIRILRFERLIAHTRTSPALSWSQAAVDFGFSDQAHLIRDFQSFTGFTPVQFMQTLPRKRTA